jgi:hypothetical protein
VATMPRTAWHTCPDPARKRRLLQGRNDYNWSRRRLAWARRRQVYHWWYVWREKYGPYRGLQTLIAAHVGVHKSTICRDFAALGLRPQAWAREAKE